MNRNKLVAVTAVASALVVGTSLALAATSSLPLIQHNDGSPSAVQAVSAIEPTIAASFAVFQTPAGAEAAPVQQELRNSFGGASLGNPVANADFSLARSAPIAGSKARAWIAPAGKEVCWFVPDPVDGYGASCASPDEISNDLAYGVMGGGSLGDKVIVAVPVQNGGTAPTAVSAAGDASALTVSGNIAAAVLPSSSKLVLGSRTVELSKFANPLAHVSEAP